MAANNLTNHPIPLSTLFSIKDTISRFYTSVTGGSPLDTAALTPTPHLEELLPAVVKALQSSSLAPFLPLKYRDSNPHSDTPPPSRPPSPPHSDPDSDSNPGLDLNNIKPTNDLQPINTKPITNTNSATNSIFLLPESQIVAATHVAAESIPHHPPPQQVLMALITLFFVYTEDILDTNPSLLQSFVLNMSSHTPTGDPILDWFIASMIPSLYTHFPPLVASMAVTACQQMLNGMVIESGLCLGVKNNDSSHLGDLRLAPMFPDWLRNKTGLSELYAVLVFGGGPSFSFSFSPSYASTVDLAFGPPGDATDSHQALSQFNAAIPCIPDFIILTNAINDVISFYKETLAGERGNYVDMRAHRDGTDLLVALRTVADEGIAAKERIVQMLKDRGASQEYRDMFDAYVAGLTRFHTSCPRYRVGELVKAAGGELEV